MLWTILILLAAAAASGPLTRLTGRSAGWVIAVPPACLTAWFAMQAPPVVAGQPVLFHLPWVPGLGVNLSFSLDGLSLLMALLITGIGAAVTVFSGGYLAGDPRQGRFFANLMLFASAMLGLVLADNVFLLFVFWELTSFSSYMLIGHYHDRPEARSAALQAFLVTGAGGLVLLLGLLMLAEAGGSASFSTLLTRGQVIRQHPTFVPMLVLIFIGAFTKSAQFPFHFWLPNAMQAPAPASAFLHAATMVKAGIYLLARLNPIMRGEPAWHATLLAVGSATVLAGTLLSLAQHDMKRLLAYSTITALGMLTLLLGAGSVGAVGAMAVFLLAHALYKSGLFLVAGAVDHETGRRQTNHLGGLARHLPVLTAAAVLGGLSMAGLPPMLGFLGKEKLLAAVIESPAPAGLVALLLLASVVLTAAAGQVAWRPFFSPRPADLRPPSHRTPPAMLAGPALLAAAALAAGLFPAAIAPLAASAASAVLGHRHALHLSLWHGLNWPLAISAVSLAGGVALFIGWDRVQRQVTRLSAAARVGPDAAYRFVMDALARLAVLQTRVLQNGLLRIYMLVVIGAAVTVVAVSLPGANLSGAWGLAEIPMADAVLAGLILLAIFAVLRARAWPTAIIAVGVVGFLISMTFVLYSAPDLAMTLFLVEALTVILFVLIIYHMPPAIHLRAGAALPLRVIAAVAGGTVMCLLTLAATADQQIQPISEGFLARSWSEAFGLNVVNVILVDFRAADTLGEITVLAVAGLGVYSLIHGGRRTGRRRRRRSAEQVGRLPARGIAPSIILRSAARLLEPLMILFSLFLLIGGHNQPGGGFSGGLAAAGAFVLHVIAFDLQSAKRMLLLDPHRLISVGLLLSLAAGLIGMAFSGQFLAGVWLSGRVAGLGEVKLGTPVLFDLGVYVTVLGVVAMIMSSLSTIQHHQERAALFVAAAPSAGSKEQA